MRTPFVDLNPCTLPSSSERALGVPERRRPSGSAPLLQERLGRRDPWRVAVICALLNRATAAQAEPVARQLFRRWPSSTAMMRVIDDLHAQGRIDLRDLLHPLGFHRQRFEAVLSLTRAAFFERRRLRSRRVDSLEAARGAGQYAAAAMRAFCLGDFSARTTDRVVSARLRYIRKTRRAR